MQDWACTPPPSPTYTLQLYILHRPTDYYRSSTPEYIVHACTCIITAEQESRYMLMYMHTLETLECNPLLSVIGKTRTLARA